MTFFLFFIARNFLHCKLKSFCSLYRQPKTFNFSILRSLAHQRLEKCCLCQKVTNEVLQCPAKSKRLDIGVGQGYSTLSASIMHLNELHELPIPVDLERLDEGNGIEATLRENKAMWHKSCCTKLNATQVRRAEKRKVSLEDSELKEVPARKYTRQSACFKMEELTCYFCVEGASASQKLQHCV